jgi:hypothetical protein
MNLGTYMMCATGLWLLMYSVQIRGTPSTSKTAATRDVEAARSQGGSGSSSATKAGGWYSSFSNFGAPEFFVSAFLFALTLGLPLDWLAPVLSLLGGGAAIADLMMRFALWTAIAIATQEVLKRWFSIELEEALVGPLVVWVIYQGYTAGTPGITHYINFVARAFGVGL